VFVRTPKKGAAGAQPKWLFYTKGREVKGGSKLGEGFGVGVAGSGFQGKGFGCKLVRGG